MHHAIETLLTQLSHAWPRVSNSGVCIKDMKALLYGVKLRYTLTIRVWSTFFTQKKLNMRQRRWLELIKAYGCEINYDPGKR